LISPCRKAGVFILYCQSSKNDASKPTCMQVLVFKTDVEYKSIAGRIIKQLDKMPGVIRSNFDLLDCDRILRVEANGLAAAQVEQFVAATGYFCRELEG
jgi:hypothetical protein